MSEGFSDTYYLIDFPDRGETRDRTTGRAIRCVVGARFRCVVEPEVNHDRMG